jgi:hypothetical protein
LRIAHFVNPAESSDVLSYLEKRAPQFPRSLRRSKTGSPSASSLNISNSLLRYRPVIWIKTRQDGEEVIQEGFLRFFNICGRANTKIFVLDFFVSDTTSP